MALDDKDLLAGIARGDRIAMKAFYHRHSEALFRFVRTRLADHFDAADVVQDTMMEVWRSAGAFEQRAAVRSWLFSIARNKAVDRIRRQSKAQTSLLDDEPEMVDDSNPDPLTAAQSAQDAARVRMCIGKLSAAHRSVVHLAFYEELNYADIAAAEDSAIGTIKTRIFHAKKLLMRCLERATLNLC